MVNIHKHAAEACEKYGLGYNLVAGANIAGFEKVAEAMMAQASYKRIISQRLTAVSTEKLPDIRGVFLASDK